MNKEVEAQSSWKTVMRPGYLGKRKDELFNLWNQTYGENNWRLVNVTKDGEVMSYEDIFWKVYVPGYVAYFLQNLDEAHYLVENYSYAYDKDIVSREAAFDFLALYNKPGIVNQFHHTSLNVALEFYLGMPFKGFEPIQVRQGKPDTAIESWPAGWKWSPGFVKSTRPDLIPLERSEGWWEDEESVEAFYQYTKALQVLAR